MNDKVPNYGDEQVIKCDDCGEVRKCRWQSDPFQREIHDDVTPLWQCDECSESSSDEI